MHSNPFERMKKKKEDAEREAIEVETEKNKYVRLGNQLGLSKDAAVVPSFMQQIMGGEEKTNVPPFGNITGGDEGFSGGFGLPGGSSKSFKTSSSRPNNQPLQEFSMPDSSSIIPPPNLDLVGGVDLEPLGSPGKPIFSNSSNSKQDDPKEILENEELSATVEFDTEELNILNNEETTFSINSNPFARKSSALPEKKELEETLNTLNQTVDFSSFFDVEDDTLESPINHFETEEIKTEPKKMFSVMDDEIKSVSLDIEDSDFNLDGNFISNVNLNGEPDFIIDNNSIKQFILIYGKKDQIEAESNALKMSINNSSIISVNAKKLFLYSSPYLFLLKQIINKIPNIIEEDKTVLWERVAIFLSPTEYGRTGTELDLILEEQLKLDDPIELFKKEFLEALKAYEVTIPMIINFKDFRGLDGNKINSLVSFATTLFQEIPYFKFIFEFSEDIVGLSISDKDFKLLSTMFDQVIRFDSKSQSKKQKQNFEEKISDFSGSLNDDSPSTPSIPSLEPSIPSIPSLEPSTPSIPSLEPSIPSLEPSIPSLEPSTPSIPSLEPSTPSIPSLEPSIPSITSTSINSNHSNSFEPSMDFNIDTIPEKGDISQELNVQSKSEALNQDIENDPKRIRIDLNIKKAAAEKARLEEEELAMKEKSQVAGGFDPSILADGWEKDNQSGGGVFDAFANFNAAAFGGSNEDGGSSTISFEQEEQEESRDIFGGYSKMLSDNIVKKDDRSKEDIENRLSDFQLETSKTLELDEFDFNTKGPKRVETKDIAIQIKGGWSELNKN